VWSAVIAAVLSVISAGGPDAPDAFVDRTPVPSCGAVLQGLSDTWQPTPDAYPEVGCLAEALRTGAGAELVAQYTTVEGDKVAYYYRVEPGRPGLELFVDASGDAFAGRPWEHAVCPHAVPDDLLEHLGGCAWDQQSR
jgi:hypothetical protein